MPVERETSKRTILYHRMGENNLNLAEGYIKLIIRLSLCNPVA